MRLNAAQERAGNTERTHSDVTVTFPDVLFCFEVWMLQGWWWGDRQTFSPYSGVIRRERVRNLWAIQRHFNKLEFMRQCGFCNTFLLCNLHMFIQLPQRCWWHQGEILQINLLLFEAEQKKYFTSVGFLINHLFIFLEDFKRDCVEHITECDNVIILFDLHTNSTETTCKIPSL